MTKLNIAPEPFRDPVPPWQDHEVREVDWPVPEDLAMVDLIELYLEIDAVLDIDRGMAIQFLAAGAGPGASEIALDMAWAAASVLGKKMLVDSGLPIISVDTMAEAATKIVAAVK